MDDKGGHELIHAGDVVQSLKAKTKGPLCQVRRHTCDPKAAEFGRQAHGLTQSGGFVGKNRFSCPIGEKTFPFMIFKENGAGHVRSFPAELCKMVDTQATTISTARQDSMRWAAPIVAPSILQPLLEGHDNRSIAHRLVYHSTF